MRYVNLAPEVSHEVDLVNATLAKELAKVDPLFSEGTTDDGKICVCLGVETKPIDNNSPVYYACTITEKIEELGLRMIIEEKFGEILTQGIKAAEKHMKVENELADVQQGIMRSIPVVGSVFNWFSPVEKQVHGKSFDIGSTSLRNVVLSPSPKPGQNNSPRATPPLTPTRATPNNITPAITPTQPSPRISEELPTPNLKQNVPGDNNDQGPQEQQPTDPDVDLPKPEPLPIGDDD